MVDVMNNVPIDAVCFGNHEADVPFASLVSRVNEFQGAWVNSNMRTFSDEVDGLKPGATPDHHVLRLEGGRTVALLGLCCGGGKDASLYRGDAFGGHAQKITPVVEAAADAVKRVQSSCAGGLDCIIPLTHQLMADDVQLCGLGLPFPCILGGHEHDVFDEVHHGTRIIKAGADGYRVAVVDLVWAAGTPPNSMPSRVELELVPLGVAKKHKGPPPQLKYAPDKQLRALCARWEKPAIELQEAVLGVYPPGSLSSVDVRKGPSTMATEIATAFRHALPRPCACPVPRAFSRALPEIE